MSVCRTVTVSITQEQDDLIRACMATGPYATAGKFAWAALQSLDRDEARDLADRTEAPPERRA